MLGTFIVDFFKKQFSFILSNLFYHFNSVVHFFLMANILYIIIKVKEVQRMFCKSRKYKKYTQS
jgi:hypothetical protein